MTSEDEENTPISVEIQFAKGSAPVATILLFANGRAALGVRPRRWFSTVGELCHFYGIEIERLSTALENRKPILV